MPKINEYKCNKCGFELQKGWGYCFYVEDDKGNRIDCHHPGESRYVRQVLGESATLEMIRERTGFNSFCICLDCLYQFRADLGESGWSPYEDLTVAIGAKVRPEKDKKECPKCKSIRVMTEFELIGETCPECNNGVIEEKWTGRIS